MGRRITGLVAALLAVFLLAPPAVAQQAGQQRGATLRIGLQQQIDSLNPFLGITLAATDIFRTIYPTLTTYSPEDFSVQPELAESWSSSPDKLTWTFRIRRGVEWSDGQPVTARDAAYTFNRMMTDPAAATANGNFVENFASVTAPAKAAASTTSRPATSTASPGRWRSATGGCPRCRTPAGRSSSPSTSGQRSTTSPRSPTTRCRWSAAGRSC